MSKHDVCPLCGVRRARRQCPALERTICAVCCATKRLVEIRCPASCPYLASAKIHPAAVVQRRQERDLAFFLPLTQGLTEPQYRVLLFVQAVVARHRAAAHPPLRDEDLASAAEALAATFETSAKGLIYEHQAASIPAQQLAHDIRRALVEAAGEAATETRLARDAGVALRRLEQGARTAAAQLGDDEEPVYLNLLGRLMTPAEGERQSPAGGGERGSGLIITG